MDAASSRHRAAPLDLVRQIDWSAAAAWLLGFGLVAYLGLEGGGYDPLVHDQIGIAVWWVLLATVLVGVLPRRRLGALAWTALGLFTAFVVWTALSLSWTESIERTAADLARVASYLGVFAVALFIRDLKGARRMIGAVGAAIVCVAVVALLSRLHPAWFPEAAQAGRFVAGAQERLSYPLNYWNGLAALIAVGLPLVLEVASCAKPVLFRAFAAAALPMLGLTLFLTLSRGGIAAAIAALVVFLVLAPDRLPKLLTLIPVAGGDAILIHAAAQRDALQHGLLDATARHQGSEVLAIAVAVCIATGLIQAGISLASTKVGRPRWTFVSRRVSLIGAAAGLLAILIAAAAINAPGRISDAWGEFKQGGQPGQGTNRLASFAGESRYQLWRSAVKENAAKPLTGTGSGTFEYWWARNGTAYEVVRDTHSLYFQTLGELGIAGFALLAGFLLTILAGGVWIAAQSPAAGRSQLAAALAGCVAFCLTAAFDWVWQIPVLPVVMLLLASVLLTARSHGAGRGAARWRAPLRAGFAATALAAIVAIAIPLASTSLVRQSEAYARAGELSAALRSARSAQNAQPDAASPRLQETLVLELQGKLPPAAAAAHAATEREPTNWRTWLILSRIEAERGRAAEAVRDYREAKSLNPRSSLFRP